MMLHERTLKNDLIKRLQQKMEEYRLILQEEEIRFNKPIQTYVGIKLHHGYVFMVNEGETITYPRGVHGSVLKNAYLQMKNKEIYVRKKSEGLTYKIKLKKV